MAEVSTGVGLRQCSLLAASIFLLPWQIITGTELKFPSGSSPVLLHRSTIGQQKPNNFLGERELYQPHDFVNVSQTCRKQMEYFLKTVKSKPFAKKMLASMGQMPKHNFEDRIIFTGDYELCLSVQSDGSDELSFTGKYCKAGRKIVDISGIRMYMRLFLDYSMCIPSGCDMDDAHTLMRTDTFTDLLQVNKTLLETFEPAILVNPGSPVPLTPGAVATITAIIISVLLIIIGTALKYEHSTRIADSTSSPVGEEATIPAMASDNTSNEVTERTPLMGDSSVVKRPPKVEKPGLLRQLLHCFSIIDSWKGLVNTTSSKDGIPVLHFARVHAIGLVAVGHCLIVSQIGLRNREFMYKLQKAGHMLPLLATATTCVDIFFLISGLLVAYAFTLRATRTKRAAPAKSWPMLYFHRYLRLSPPYFITFMIWLTVLSYMGDGPIWPDGEALGTKGCTTWWANLLYINNLYGLMGCGATWTWYMACDMQYYLVAVPVMTLVARKRNTGLAVIVGLIVLSMVAGGALTGIFNLPLTATTLYYFGVYYQNPFVRFQAYGVGMLAGYILAVHRLRDKPLRLHWVVPIVLWGFTAAMGYSTIMAPVSAVMGEIDVSKATSVIFNAMYRTAVATFFGSVIVLCTIGYGGFLNKFMCWKGFIIVSKISYCTYLTNIPTIVFLLFQTRQPMYGSVTNQVILTAGVFLINLIVGLVASLLWEGPAIQLANLLKNVMVAKPKTSTSRS